MTPPATTSQVPGGVTSRAATCGNTSAVWGGESQSRGNDHLVVLKVSRDAAGELQAAVVTQIKGVIFPGPSALIDNVVYFNKAGATDLPLHSYNVVTGEDTTIATVPVDIFSRNWEPVELDDPDWPGTTLVGWNSQGRLVKWNIKTGHFARPLTDDIPATAIGLNSITSGSDGRIWTAGHLTGGLGAVSPMRSDHRTTYARRRPGPTEPQAKLLVFDEASGERHAVT